MKKINLIILFILITHLLLGQTYLNEWINYSQKYYKVPIVEDGIYKITYQDLLNSGFFNNTFDPRNIQIFQNGREKYIYVKGENDGVFNSTDYILFYAKKNTGSIDSVMFDSLSSQTNKNYSFITDTSAVFVTFNNSLANKRLILENDTAFFTYPSQNYIFKKIHQDFTSSYYFGKVSTELTNSEGWFDSYYSIGSYRTKTINTPNVYILTPVNTTIKFAVAGISNAYSYNYLNHHLKVSANNIQILDTLFYEYNAVKYSTNLSTTLLSSTNQIKFESINDLNITADKQAISYIEIKYPHSLDLENLNYFDFYAPNTSGTKSFYNFTNFDNSTNINLWDITNNKIITTVDDGTNIKANIENTGNEKHCIIFNDNAIKSISKITETIFNDYSTYQLNSEFIIITDKNLETSANQYKTYKSTKYNTNIFYINDIYNQFAYGVNKHPIAIRNFVNYIINTYDFVPKYLLLLGKSIHSYLFRHNQTYFNECLVPSFGNPSSDILLTSGLNGTIYEPAIPIGRIAAANNTDVLNYLDKLKDFELNQPAEWMKNILHFGGGYTIAQQQSFAGYLNNYKNIIEDTLFGGYVSTFIKSSSAPMQISQSDSVKDLINNGCSMLTFFGHGSTSGFDQSIDEPTVYNNDGKYPLILANSCLAGDIHLAPPQKISEKWILTQDKGAIAFLASVDLGYESYLNGYSTEFYKQLSYKNYGQGLGEIIQQTIKQYETVNISDNKIKSTCLEMTLHGDPSVVLNSFRKPDFVIDISSISTIPEIIYSETDSFTLQVIIKNIGAATNQPFVVEVTQTLPDNSIITKDINVNGCLYSDTVYTKLPINKINGIGLNSICVFADVYNDVDELNETNNQACISTIIRSGDLTPIYPYKYAIYPNSTVTLKASTGDPFITQQTSIFQVDTNDYFVNPIAQTTITHSGGVVEWSLPLTLTDSTVYYWRVSKVPASGNNYNWKESSFIYIPGKFGWSQAHFFQFKNDAYNLIEYNRPYRKYDYITTPKTLTCHNIGSPATSDYFSIKYTLEGISDYACCGGSPAIIVTVIDSSTLIPWESNRGNYGHRDYPKCYSRSRNDLYFVFSVDSAGLQSLINFFNIIPNGDYILIYSFKGIDFQSWNSTTYQAFENLGAMGISSVPNNYPYIFFCQKGKTSTAQEILGSTATDIIDFSTTLNTNYNIGNFTSETIGPSTQWKSLHWRFHSLETNNFDSVRLQVSGIKLNGTQDILMDSIPHDSLDFYDLNNRFSAVDYPFLKLNFYTRDDTNKTPSQINRWQLTYNGVAETAINPSDGYYFYNDTVNEGDIIKFAVATKNVSQYNMDSLMVEYNLKDKNGNIHKLATKLLRKHPSGDVIIDTISFNTTNYPGLNSIWIEYNPIDSTTGYYNQLEQYHFNNIAEKYFYVNSDKINPLLDVTFDGIHILDGDIVSAKPKIVIKLKDENKFLALNDTSLFAVYLKSNETGDEKRIYFTDANGNEQMKWTKAVLPDNSFTIEYNPDFIADGKYQLRVQAKDISNNESGDNDYTINFEVITKSTITNIFNYPNPFSTSTRFVFTLTGSQIPDDFRIQILTVSGKLVREITLQELGNIHIGRNITDYAWDGKDMFGDQLANGVYFYRVITKINNQAIEKRETSADKYFKKGFGKMYLMR